MIENLRAPPSTKDTEIDHENLPTDIANQDAMWAAEMGDQRIPAHSEFSSQQESRTPYIHMEFDKEFGMNENATPENSLADISLVSSTTTADEIADIRGFIIICLVTLISDMPRGVLFPTLWPLVESLGGTEITQGYAVASFSLGRIIISPILGSWSITFGYRWTLIVSSSVLLLGCVLYAFTEAVGSNTYLIITQVIMGLGGGTLGVTRAYVADITPKRHRTTYLAWVFAVQYFAFAVTPAFGAMFAQYYKDEDKIIRKGFFVLDAYTSPAYFLATLVIVTMICLALIFQDRERAEPQSRKSKKRMAIEELANCSTCLNLTVYDLCIIWCMVLNAATKGALSSFETLGIHIAQVHFAMSSHEAGFIVSLCGAVGVSVLLFMGFIARVLTDIQMINYGMIVMTLGVMCLALLNEDGNNPTWRYFVSSFLVYGIGFPIGHTAVIGLFSKIVGRKPQGTLLGWFASAGSFARVSFPILSGYIDHYQGLDALILVLITTLTISIIVTFIARDTMEKLSL